MEDFEVIPELFWSSFEEEEMLLEGKAAVAQLLAEEEPDHSLRFLLGAASSSSSSSSSSSCNPFLISSSGYEPHYLIDPNASYLPLNCSLTYTGPNYQFEELNEANSNDFTECNAAPEQLSQEKRKHHSAEVNEAEAGKTYRTKKACGSSASKEQKGNRNGDKEDNNCCLISRITSSCSLEDDWNAFQEHDEGPSSKISGDLNPNEKTRTGRGAATEPQSIYARKRRERINKRLKILQNLVPNGTKVDISTMLEEAVQYVKFLQLQIKLLSSDELWMYSPLAFNGMNVWGLDLI